MRTGHLTHEDMQVWVMREDRKRRVGLEEGKRDLNTESGDLGLSPKDGERDLSPEDGNSMNAERILEIRTHLSYCTACQEELAVYTLMLPILETMPAAAFDFDVAEMVLANLPERQVGVSIGMIMVYLMAGIGVLAGLVALFMLTRYLAFNMVAGMGTVMITGMLVFQFKEMIGQYHRQMRTLEHG